MHPPKQVIVMRKDLNMRKGKMCAQAAHASMKVLLDRMEKGDVYVLRDIPAPMQEWFEGIFTKVCVSVDSEAELRDIYAKAQAAGLPCALIVDVGATEFHGVPTPTCCAIGPDDPAKIDPITGALKLL